MDFLTLCQRVRQETGIADSGPAAVTGQTGDMKRIVDWVNESWMRIQSMRPDWLWMWAVGNSSLTVGDETFTLPSAVESLSDVLVDGSFMQEIEYRDYRTLYRTVNEGKPTAYAVRPDGVVVFNAKPDLAYSIIYEYQSKPAYFTQNIDAPGMPERFHMLIVWHALAEYGMFDEAPELVQKARVNFENALAELVIDQTPAMKLPGTIA